MLFTVTTILFFCLIAIAAVVAGHYSEKQELYAGGAVLLFLVGLLMLGNGVSEFVGTNETTCDWRESYTYGDNYSGYHWDYETPRPACNPNNLDCIELFHVNRTYMDGCVETDVYDETRDVWTNAFGLLFVVVGAGLLLTWYRRRSDDKKLRERGLDTLDDE